MDVNKAHGLLITVTLISLMGFKLKFEIIVLYILIKYVEHLT